MNRTFKLCLFAIVGCFCLIWVHTAEPAGDASQPKPATQAVPQNAPSIQIPEATYDFGEVAEGKEVVHDFKIKNTGKAELQIDQVRPG